MNPVRPDSTHPSRKARVRNRPDWAKLNASVCPSAFLTATEVRKTRPQNIPGRPQYFSCVTPDGDARS